MLAIEVFRVHAGPLDFNPKPGAVRCEVLGLFQDETALTTGFLRIFRDLVRDWIRMIVRATEAFANAALCLRG